MSNGITIDEWYEEIRKYFYEEFDKTIMKDLEEFVKSEESSIQFIKHVKESK